MLNAVAAVLALLLEVAVFSPSVTAQIVKSSWQADWEKTIELAKREGKVVVSIPASSELRAELEKHFEKRYGVDVEPVVGRAPTVVRKMADEAKAGVRYIDLHMGGHGWKRVGGHGSLARRRAGCGRAVDDSP